MIKTLIYSTYYQLLIFTRLKQALFFTITFPVFLFIVFGSIWGAENKEYISFILSGLIGMTVMSDGLFAVGSVIKEYYDNGLIKYFRKLPFNILIHFSGLIISRVISLLFTVLLLCIASSLVFDYSVSFIEVKNFIFGIFIGLFLFSFLGLLITFSGIKENGKGLINIVYFLILFTSDAFYPVSEFNDLIGLFGNILPLNDILSILRGTGFNITIVFWLIFSVTGFYFLFNRIKFTR
jgi:hypothetical protein|tara:strand:- start:337 stop:1047 length:711 start_codon:yes stop_codon:yes gene_type:complete